MTWTINGFCAAAQPWARAPWDRWQRCWRPRARPDLPGPGGSVRPTSSRPGPAKLVFQDWSLSYGGGMAWDAVLGQLHWSAGLLDALCPARLRPALFAAVIDLANTAGYIAMDAGADGEARRIYRFALDCAEDEENGDWHLRAEVLGHMVVHAIQTGQPDEALTLAEQALVRADRLTATQRSTLHTDRASALATMRRVQETLTAIGTADDHFAQSTPANDHPSWPSSTTPLSMPCALGGPGSPWGSWVTTPVRPLTGSRRQSADSPAMPVPEHCA
ncbi:MAG: tetratricopeptide repeat protein [Pseudonocardiaceae bacterium]